jgi:hypothetical protein
MRISWFLCLLLLLPSVDDALASASSTPDDGVQAAENNDYLADRERRGCPRTRLVYSPATPATPRGDPPAPHGPGGSRSAPFTPSSLYLFLSLRL